MQTRRISDISMISAIVALILGFSASPTLAQTSTCEDNGTVEVCVEWSDPVAGPVEGTHYRIEYHGGAGADVQLLTGDLEWRLWTTLVSTGAVTSFGDITLDPTVSSDDFEVTIANGAGAGAANVGLINLNDAGFTGYSSLEDSTISGNLGGLTLVKDGSGNGGVLHNLEVSGNLTGPLTVPFVEGTGLDQSIIVGNVIGGADITIGKLNVGDFRINGNLVCSGGTCPDITVTDKIYRGLLTVFSDVPSGSTVKVEELEEAGGGGTTTVDLSNAGTFAGTLDLPIGLGDANTLIDMGGTFSGTIDLHGGGVAENAGIDLYVSTSAAVIKNGGAVSGEVYLASNIPDKDYDWEGTATFASISSTGEIATQTTGDPVDDASNITGTLTVTGDVSSGGLIEIVGSLLWGAEINIGTELTGGLMAGHIDIEQDCTGNITIYKDLSGDIDIGDDQSGDVCITRDVTSTGDVVIVGALANASLLAGGRILVGGENNGHIKVGENTGSLTLIQVAGGLATASTIEVNTTRGSFDAEGDIHIGPGATPVALPFDGCIRIFDDGAGGSGALDGDIAVVACHDPAGETLVICVDGDINGDITLEQTGCDGTDADWGCEDPPNCPPA